jgi:type I restriction enzyme S subunit
MGSIGEWGAGATPAKGNIEYYNGNILWLRTGELNNDVVFDTEIKVTEKALKECSLRLNKVGDVMIAMYGATIGKVAIVGKEMTTNQACCACTPIGIFNWYLFYFLMASQQDFIKKGEGGAQPNISREKLIAHLMPVPPIEEQRRIVSKIREILPWIEKYAYCQNEQNLRNESIKPMLRKSILQEAIQGKLVPQDPNEEPASVLLEKIRAEKVKLVKEVKLKKKDLVESTIFRGDDNKYFEKKGKDTVCIDEEIPFEIPNTWEWVRLSDVVQVNPKNDVPDNTLSAFIPMERIDATYLSSFTYSERKWGDIKAGFTHFADGDVAFAKITPCFQNRKSMILKGLPNGVGAGTTELKVLRPYAETIDREYLLFFLESSYFVEEATFKGTANQQRIISGYMENKLFPLPPLSEQRRISEKIKESYKRIGL